MEQVETDYALSTDEKPLYLHYPQSLENLNTVWSMTHDVPDFIIPELRRRTQTEQGTYVTTDKYQWDTVFQGLAEGNFGEEIEVMLCFPGKHFPPLSSVPVLDRSIALFSDHPHEFCCDKLIEKVTKRLFQYHQIMLAYNLAHGAILNEEENPPMCRLCKDDISDTVFQTSNGFYAHKTCVSHYLEQGKELFGTDPETGIVLLTGQSQFFEQNFLY